MDSTFIFVFVVAAFCGYVIGSIPFGLLVTTAFGMADPRTTGSGNIGATNVLRSGNRLAAAATLALDCGKGAGAVMVVWPLFGEEVITAAAGVAAVVGHCFPVWLRFKGGKGVATGIGAVFAMNPLCGVIIGIAWLAVAFMWRMSSLAALIAFPVAAIALLIFGTTEFAVAGFVMAALIAYRHRDNIRRIRGGTEPKIGL